MARSVLHTDAIVAAGSLSARGSADLRDRVVQNLNSGRARVYVDARIPESESGVADPVPDLLMLGVPL
jgi:hypothetical protein